MRRNPLRSLATASLLLVSAVSAGLLAAPPQAGAANNVLYTVSVTDTGFSQTTIDAQVGDELIFQLDTGAMQNHTLAWESGQLEFPFSHRPGRSWVRYGPLKAGGPLRYYDSSQVPGPDVGGPFTGVLMVTDGSAPPTTTTTARPTTTTTRPVTTTTTVPTTPTTAPGAIHPLLVSGPDPTTTTWAPVSLPVTAAPVKSAPAPTTTTTAAKDNGKAKGAPATSTTTAPPAPPVGEIFDAATLTPAPDGPAAAVTDLASSANIDAALAGILHPDRSSDDGRPMMLIALGALAVFLVAGGAWHWHHRSSRYFPA